MEIETFELRFEGKNGRPWISIIKQTQGASFTLGFEKEEIDWILDYLKKAIEMDRFLGFSHKFKVNTRVHLLEVKMNINDKFLQSLKFVTNRKTTFQVIL